MITLTDSIPEKAENADICFARISCHFAAYGKYPKITSFWKQTDGNKVTAYFSLFGGCLTVFENGGDTGEILSFIKMISPQFIFTAEKTAKALKLNILETNFAFLHTELKETHLPENTLEGVKVLAEKLCSCFENTDFDSLYVDLSHSARHNCLNYVTTGVSAAVMQLSAYYGVITGICVEKSCRNKGVGSGVLAKLLSGVRGKSVFCVAKEEIKEFYIKNGFTEMGKYSLCKGNV